MVLTIAEVTEAVEEAVAERDAKVTAMVLGVMTVKYPLAHITNETDIFGSGLTDSQGFLDIILEVEAQTGMTFNPEALDFNGAMTPLTLAQAFKAS